MMNRIAKLARGLKGKVLLLPAVRWLGNWPTRLRAQWETLDPGSIMIIPAEDKNSILVYLRRPQRSFSYLVQFDTGERVSLNYPRSEFEWRLHGASLDDSNVALVYEIEERSGRRSISGEIEILRQTEDALKREYGSTHKGGYLVIGRNTFALMRSPRRTMPQVEHRSEILVHLTRKERESLRASFPSLVNPQVPEYDGEESMIEALSGVLRALFLRLNKTGPSDLVLGVRSPTELLEIITEEKATLQCTGTRDLFLDLAVSLRTIVAENVRKVDAFRYEPVPDIVVNSHSLMEVSLDGRVWMAFDPFARMYFADDDGDYLSTTELRAIRLENQLQIIRPQVINTVAKPYDIEQLRDVDPHNYNYWCHFNLLSITGLALSD